MQIVKQVGCCAMCPVAEINWEAGYLYCKVLDNNYVGITIDFNPDTQVYMFCPWRNPETTLKIEIVTE